MGVFLFREGSAKKSKDHTSQSSEDVLHKDEEAESNSNKKKSPEDEKDSTDKGGSKLSLKQPNSSGDKEDKKPDSEGMKCSN